MRFIDAQVLGVFTVVSGVSAPSRGMRFIDLVMDYGVRDVWAYVSAPSRGMRFIDQQDVVALHVLEREAGFRPLSGNEVYRLGLVKV